MTNWTGNKNSVYQFTERLLCAKNADFDGMKRGGGSAVSYAWFVFTRETSNDTPRIYFI